MTYKVCASCGKHIRDTEPACWNCKSTEFATTVTVGVCGPAMTSASAAALSSFWAGTKAAARGFQEEAKKQADIRQWGKINDALICPHCQTKGQVRALPSKRKIGLSGAKVMGGLLTGGVSLLATGLSQKHQVTQAHCGNCGSTWDF